MGNEFDSQGAGFEDRNAFGGELYKVNVFDKELSVPEVKGDDRQWNVHHDRG